jgi:hypothetical protein
MMRSEALAVGLPSPTCGERVAGPEPAKDRLGEGPFNGDLGIDNPSPSRFAATPSPQGGGDLRPACFGARG